MANAVSAMRGGLASIAQCQFAGLTVSMVSVSILICASVTLAGSAISATLANVPSVCMGNALALSTVSASMAMRVMAAMCQRAYQAVSMAMPQVQTSAHVIQDGLAEYVTKLYAQMSVENMATASNQTSVSVTQRGTRAMSLRSVTH